MIKKIKALKSIFLFCAGLAIQPLYAADLLEIYQSAATHDATLSAAKLTSSADSLVYDVDRASLFPTLSVNFNQAEQRSLSDTNRSGLLGELSFNQNIWSPALQIRLDQILVELDLYEKQLVQAENDLIYRVVFAYFEVLAAQDNLETAVTESIAIEEFMAQALRRLEVGLGTLADVRNAEARRSLAHAAIIQAESAIESAWLSLTEIAGERPTELAALVNDIQIAGPQPAELDWWVKTASENNILLALQRKAIEVAEYSIELSTAESMPVISFSLSVREVMTGDRFVDTRTSAFLNFSKSFSGGGLRRVQRKRSTLYYEAEREKLRALEQQVKTQVSNAYLSVISTVNQVSALEAALEASESALLATEEGYNVGTLASLDVLNAQSDLFQVRRDLQRARYNFMQSSIQLEQVAGTLDTADLNRVNQFLN